MLSAILLAAALQDKHTCPPNPPSQADVDRAVARGVEYLSGALKKVDLDLEAHGGHTLDELALAALVYGGRTEEHEDVQRLLKRTLSRTPSRTYETVFLCVALDKLDAEVYLWKLVECGQFLLDNECENGQWSYGRPVALNSKTQKLIDELKVWGEQRRRSKAKGTKVRPRIELTPKPIGPARGDNSNTQVAALGLRICTEAGIVFPRKNLERAREWWLTTQEADGSWGYGAGGEKDEGYLSMTGGGVSSLLILQALLGRDPKASVAAKSIEKGRAWLAANFTFHPRRAVYMRAPYTHYSIERAGILGASDTIGPHPWYAEGAFDLLKSQDADGAWTLTRVNAKNERDPLQWAVIDTSLAILFFKKSVRPPVASGGAEKR